MKKVFILLASAAMMAFVSCSEGAEASSAESADKAAAEATTAAPETTGPTNDYPSTPELIYPTTKLSTANPDYPPTPARRLCTARMMKQCRCSCKNAGPPESKMKCDKKQKKVCPCKCINH